VKSRRNIRQQPGGRIKLANATVTRAIPQILECSYDGHGDRQGNNKPQNSGKVPSEKTEHYYERWMNLHLRALDFGRKQVVLK
jgi:hypothetical protein